MKKEEKDLHRLTKNRMNRLVLSVLSDGKAYTLIELADHLKTSATDLEMGLDDLLREGIIVVEKHRHRYYKLPNKETIDRVNAFLKPLMNEKQKRFPERETLPDLEYCRSCHHHLAGKIGVELTKRMQEKKILVLHREGEKFLFSVTPEGETFFDGLGINISTLRRKNGILAKACLDFSERLHHLGGKLGVAFLAEMKTKDWIVQTENSRVHHLTEKGKKALKEIFQLDLEPNQQYA